MRSTQATRPSFLGANARPDSSPQWDPGSNPSHAESPGSPPGLSSLPRRKAEEVADSRTSLLSVASHDRTVIDRQQVQKNILDKSIANFLWHQPPIYNPELPAMEMLGRELADVSKRDLKRAESVQKNPTSTADSNIGRPAQIDPSHQITSHYSKNKPSDRDSRLSIKKTLKTTSKRTPARDNLNKIIKKMMNEVRAQEKLMSSISEKSQKISNDIDEFEKIMLATSRQP